MWIVNWQSWITTNDIFFLHYSLSLSSEITKDRTRNIEEKRKKKWNLNDRNNDERESHTVLCVSSFVCVCCASIWQNKRWKILITTSSNTVFKYFFSRFFLFNLILPFWFSPCCTAFPFYLMSLKTQTDWIE